MINYISDLGSKYNFITTIGRGNEGNVIKVQSKENQNKYFAIKELTTDLKSPKEKEDFFKLIDILKSANHPSILQYIGFTLDNNLNTELKNHPALIFDFMPHTLQDLIEDDKLTMPDTYIILLGIAEGMKYLHSIRIVHRDLKPSNILLDSNLYPYIGDLGCAKIVSNLTKKELGTFKGTLIYMAPEVSDDKYDYTCDIYSYAILFYQLFTKKEPYNIDTNTNIFSFYKNKICNGTRPDLSIIKQIEIKEFLEKCWSSVTTERIPFDHIVEILKTEKFRKFFFVKNDPEYLMAKCADILKQQLFEVKDKNELFQLACMMGNVELAKYILNNGSIDVNAYKITVMIYQSFNEILIQII